MKAKDFNKLKVGDKVVIPAPVGINAVNGKIVAKLVALITPANDKSKDGPAELGEATVIPWGFYHDAETRLHRDLKQELITNAAVYSDKIDPYTWAFHDPVLYTDTRAYDKLAIADPAGFMKGPAQHSWKTAKGFYAAGTLSHPDGGMQALLDYRSYLADLLVKSMG